MSSIDINKEQWKAFHCSHQGASHKKIGKVCQDAAFSSDGNRYALAIVCDGHGSTNYFRSDKGAKLAQKAVQNTLREFMGYFLSLEAIELEQQFLQQPDKFMRQLVTNIVYNWRKAVKKDFCRHPFRKEELAQVDAKHRTRYETESETYFVKAYGTTLIAVIIFPNHFWFGLHIGDGKCVACYEDGSWGQPSPWDEACFLNVTTSLCDEKAIEEFRYCLHTDRFPVALFVGSDGVDDSFLSNDDLYVFYQELYQTFQEKGRVQERKEFDCYLPILSEKGSGDDISISGIIKNIKS